MLVEVAHGMVKCLYSVYFLYFADDVHDPGRLTFFAISRPMILGRRRL
jgi:hypothetical protein